MSPHQPNVVIKTVSSSALIYCQILLSIVHSIHCTLFINFTWCMLMYVVVLFVSSCNCTNICFIWPLACVLCLICSVLYQVGCSDGGSQVSVWLSGYQQPFWYAAPSDVKSESETVVCRYTLGVVSCKMIIVYIYLCVSSSSQ